MTPDGVGTGEKASSRADLGGNDPKYLTEESGQRASAGSPVTKL
jgi:hypothetical protein